MTIFCLVRHGQTDWNLEGRYQGQSDIPLNEVGRAQAYTLARQLKEQSFTAVYSSDLKRAIETGVIIAKALGMSVTIDSRLREINQGEWEGQLVEVIKARYVELWQQRSVDPAGVRPPGGETVGEVAHRVYKALDDIAHLHPNGNVLITSHGLALATIICKDKKIPIGQAYDVIPDNAEPAWVHWKD
jgi:broad specificity phosphatase PhoE